MNRIEKAFADKKAYIPFLTAGDPDVESTMEYILALEKAGADMIQLGIPFSDPIAEGTVIQEADIRALSGGVTTDVIFEMVEKLRQTTQIPLVFMAYANLVFHYGYERFFANCQKAGVDGIVIPDISFEEKKEVEQVADAYQITLISTIASVSEARIKKIAADAKGFIYLAPTEEMKQKMDLETMAKAIRSVTDVPIALCSGRNAARQLEAADDLLLQEMQTVADGCIEATAIVELTAAYKKQAAEQICTFVHKVKSGFMKKG